MKRPIFVPALLTALAAVLPAPAAFAAHAPPRLEIVRPPANRAAPAARLAPGAAARDLALRISGQPDQVYQIQVSLDGRAWTPILAVRLADTTFQFRDPERLGSGQALYRAVPLGSAPESAPPLWPDPSTGSWQPDREGPTTVRWSPALDDTGVAEYLLFLDGREVGGVTGNFFQAELPELTLDELSRLTVRAVDPFGNRSAELFLQLQPVEALTMIGNDNGQIQTFYRKPDGTYSGLALLYDFPYYVRGGALADYNHDGLLDLVSGDAYTSSNFALYFFQGRADGTFATPVALPPLTNSSSYLMDCATGDFDADGNPDVLANGNNDALCLYWGNGDGTFTAERRSYPSAGRGMDAGDFNEDGIDDFVRTTYSDGIARLYLSNGDRTFQAARTVGDSGGDPYGLAAGDFDEDGHLDVIANEGGSGDITFFKGNGDGTFAAGVATPSLDVNNHGAFDAYDYNQDGHLDIAITTYSSRAVYIYHGLGNATFDTANRISIGTTSDYSLGLSAPPLPFPVQVEIDPKRPTVAKNANLTLTAIGSGVAPGDTFAWTFGNPAAGTAATNPAVYAYPEEGYWTARLTHTNAASRISKRGTIVEVVGDPPVADTGGPYVLAEGASNGKVWTGALDATGSTDDSGLTAYLWEFDHLTANKLFYQYYEREGADWTALPNFEVLIPVATGYVDNVTITGTYLRNDHWGLRLSGYLTIPADGTYTFYVSSDDGNRLSIDGRVVVLDDGVHGGRESSGTITLTTGPHRFLLEYFQSTSSRSLSASWAGPGLTKQVIPASAFSAANFVHRAQPAVSWPTPKAPGDALWPVKLTVTDTVGQTDDDATTAVFSAGDPPVAVITGPDTIDEAAAAANVWTANFSSAGSTDDSGLWKCVWDFGNGKTQTVIGTRASPPNPAVTTTYTAVGTYTITLTVYDHAGQSATDTHTLEVQNNDDPVARITGPDTVDETSALNGVWTTSFNASASTDDFAIWKYEWNFGNGSTSTQANPTVTYNQAKTYTVTLKAYDHANQTHTATQEVLVKANDLPVPAFSGPESLDETAATAGKWRGTWDAAATTDDVGIWKYEWDWGDGTTAGSGVSATHDYAAVGTYNLKLTVTDHGRQPVSLTKEVTVADNDDPVARITAPVTAVEGAAPLSFSAATSSDDFQIYRYRWLLGEKYYPFYDSVLDRAEWTVAGNVTQANRVSLLGNNNWGQNYAFNKYWLTARGSVLQMRVDTPAGSAATHAMFGFKNTDPANGQYGAYIYCIYFDNGALRVYEKGNHRGQFGSYTKGISYEIRIETKPTSGAIYFIRPYGTGAEWTKMLESNNYSETEFSFGADVYAGTYHFDELTVSNLFRDSVDLVTSVYPSAEISLQVTDDALQQHTAVQPITLLQDDPPVARITGPDLSITGVRLHQFSGALSTDDHGIAAYEWDWGDGTAKSYGMKPSHYFRQNGVLTVTLTVYDWLGQTHSTTFPIEIIGPNKVIAVPWRMVGNIELPHETYDGATITLKAVASKELTVPFTYVWDFGDGSAPETGTVTTAAERYNLEARHIYLGTDGLPFTATISVTDAGGTVAIDTYPVLVREKTIEVEINVAIDEGLWYIHKNQTLADNDTETPKGYWTFGGYVHGVAASCIQSFIINGHLETNDASQDPYVETVARGMNDLFTRLSTQNISVQTYGDPDTNGNGLGLYGGTSGNYLYQTGQIMDAIVAGGKRTLVARTGGANVLGRTYQEIVQDMCDYYNWAQYDHATVGGGWRYNPNEHPDNSACQWAAIGYYAAENHFGCTVPQWVKDRNAVWLNYSQHGTGGYFGYTDTGPYGSTTPSGMVQLAWLKIPTTDPRWTKAEDYLAGTSGYHFTQIKNSVDWYPVYAVVKCLRLAYPEPVAKFKKTGLDWFFDPIQGMARYLLDLQSKTLNADYGSWTANGHVSGRVYCTTWGVNMLSSSLFRQAPVAVIFASPNPASVGQLVTFDARGSFHQDVAYSLVDYRWDFDSSDGINFDKPDAIGPVVTYAYAKVRPYTVTLQVGDNHDPADYDTATLILNVAVPPNAPKAVPGGPYIATVGEDVEFDGGNSYDIDQIDGDRITAWDWEIDFAQPLDYDDGLSGSVVVLRGGYSTAGIRNVGLRVTDDTEAVYPDSGYSNRTHAAFTTVTVYNEIIKDLAVRPKGNKGQLTWTKKGDYGVIFRGEIGPNAGYVEIGRTESSFATFLDADIDLNKDYFYRVYAYQRGSATPLGISNAAFTYSRNRGDKNQPPVFTSAPFLAAEVGDLYFYTPTTFDRESDDLTIRLLEGPEGMTFDAADQTLKFTPTLAQVGPHQVSLEVSDGSARGVQNYQLIVFPGENTVPTVVVNGPYHAILGQPIAFDSTGTTDPDPDEDLVYTWNFGDGKSSTAAHPSHTYAADGEYVVTLWVTDSQGATASASTRAVVERPNRPPLARLAGAPNFNRRLGETLTLDASASEDLDAGDTLSFGWAFGDGQTADGPNPVAAHAYAAVGTYNGTLTVSDQRGGSTPLPFVVRLDPANQVPVPSLVVVESGPEIMDNWIFDGRATTDGENDPLLFTWDFGDGYKTNGSIVSHAFRRAGDFTVTMTVNDGRGGVATATRAVHINAPPVFGTTPPTGVKQDVALVYTPTVTDADGDPLLIELIQAPDGMTFTGGVLRWTPTNDDVGQHEVVLRATDQVHGTVTLQIFLLTVENVNDAPVLFSTGPAFAVDDAPYVYQVNAYDVDGDPLAFSLLGGPAGLAMDAQGRITWQATPDLVGQTFNASAKVQDPLGASDTEAWTITVITGKQPPIAHAGDDVTDAIVGREVTISGTNSEDPNGNETITAFQWSFLSVPAGSGYKGLGTAAVGFAFTPDRPGDYLIELLVKDNTNLWSAPDTVTVTADLAPLNLHPSNIRTAEVVVDPLTLDLSGLLRFDVVNSGGKSLTLKYRVIVFQDLDRDGAWNPALDALAGELDLPDVPDSSAFYEVFIALSGQVPFAGAPLHLLIDSEGQIEETDETDNLASTLPACLPATADCADLTVSLLRTDRTGLPAQVGLTARLANAGTETVPAGAALAFYDGDPAAGGLLLGTVLSTVDLAPWAFQDLTLTWANPAIAPHDIWVVADPAGAVPERDNANNSVHDPSVDLTANNPPVAAAGPDQAVSTNAVVVLNGSASTDPEGKPLTYRWRLLRLPSGSLADLDDPASPTPAFVADQAGEYVFDLTVRDGVHSSEPDTVTITATVANPNRPPNVTSTPTFVGMVSVQYRYQVTATDPDSDALTYELSGAPTGMAITAAGLLTWTPSADGKFPVQVVIKDGKGHLLTQAWTITVLPFENRPPAFSTVPPDNAKAQPGTLFTFDFNASDFNGDAVTFELVTGPAGLTIHATTGVLSWTPTEAQLGSHDVTVRAKDASSATTLTFRLVVVKDAANSPVVGALPDRVVTEPATFPAIPLDDLVTDPTFPDDQITWSASGNAVLTVTFGTDLFGKRVANVEYPAGARVSEKITLLAANPNGFSGFASATYTVRGPDTTPVAAFANLSTEETTAIKTAEFELLGTADDPDAVDAVSYRLGLYRPDGTLLLDMTPAPLDADGYHQGRVPAGGVLATLDFGLVNNGVYDLYLDVRGGSRTTYTSATIAIEAELKVGRFAFTQRDLVLPVHGLPLTVSRTYDSINLGSGDFGYGWTYTVTDLDIEFDESRVETEDLFGEPFTLRTGGGRNVTLTMPDSGKRVTFVCDFQGGGWFKTQAVWRAPRGVHASLRPTVSPNIISLFSLPPYWEAAGMNTSIENFDFPGFILTTQDGVSYRVDRRHQGSFFLASGSYQDYYVDAYEGAFITRIDERAGDRTQINRAGEGVRNIEHYDSDGKKTKSLQFTRDARNRITAVYDPASLDDNSQPIGPAALVYEYDASGNLSKVHKLRDASDPAHPVYETTSYLYENWRFPHYLTGIQDPSGNPPMRTLYDDEGRVIATIDSFGNKTEFRHDDAAKTQTVYDRNGNPTVNVYDDQGNIIASTNALGQTLRRTFDEDGHVTSETDALGRTTTYIYDRAGNRIRTTDPLGFYTAYSYDDFGNALSKTDARGNTARNTYDAQGRLTRTTDALGYSLTSEYDAAGRVVATTNARGFRTTYEYDAAGHKVKETDPLGAVTTWTYDRNGNPASMTRTRTTPQGPRAMTTLYEYDRQNRLVRETFPGGASQLITYHTNGRREVGTSPRGLELRQVFDEADNLVATIYPDGTEESFLYDAEGNLARRVDRLGRATNFTYDVANRLTKTTYADGSTTLNTYDAAGAVIKTTNERGQVQEFTRDTAGRRTGLKDAALNSSTWELDPNGNETKFTDALGQVTRYEYDALNRRTRIVYDDGSAHAFVYDGAGNKVSETDPAGRVTRYEYDALNRLIKVVDDANFETAYAYDEVGNLVAQTDALGRVTRYEYDDFGHKTRVTLPGGQFATMSYDLGGNLASYTDYLGRTTTFEYDLNDRLSRKTYPDGSVESFLWSATGKVLSESGATGTTAYSYDSRDRLSSRTDPDGTVLAYTYQPNGLLASLTTPAGKVSYDYDAVGRLNKVTAPDNAVTTYTYDKVGNRKSIVYPNGTSVEYEYNRLNRLTKITHKKGAAILASHTYTLGPAGNRTKLVEADGRTVDWEYDNLYRLTKETVTDAVRGNRLVEYAYDAVGNRLSLKLDGAETASTYDVNDRLLSAGAATYTYDANGNTLTRTEGGQTTTYTYDFSDRLVQASAPGQNTRYAYDVGGNRIRSEVNGVVTRFLVDTARTVPMTIEERTGGGVLLAHYLVGDDLLRQTRGAVHSYYHHDGQLSIRALSDSTGAISDTYHYDAFGNLLTSTGTTVNRHRYTGQSYEASTGLYYLRARFYQPSSGRFLTTDPLPGSRFEPATLHKYSYANNDAINRSDPDGRFFSLVSVMVSISISENIRSTYTSNLVKGFLDIQQTAFCILEPAYVMQEIAYAAIASGGGEWAFQLESLAREQIAIGFQQIGRRIKQIYIDTAFGLVSFEGVFKDVADKIWGDLNDWANEATNSGPSNEELDSRLEELKEAMGQIIEANKLILKDPEKNCEQSKLIKEWGDKALEYMPEF